ncbi:hypothetical protein NA57DRAFT_56228 [Rhizodiscina lignyota]|uniref:Uncharacterized protein n=1 Tax=Rhizodiscina lignyota TaxID=1504668 RepID=A0A9P4IB09_9PEZI|nr:hypothetical protein NA57DRAFT_56228 [Rhizodiscina lignyota]
MLEFVDATIRASTGNTPHRRCNNDGRQHAANREQSGGSGKAINHLVAIDCTQHRKAAPDRSASGTGAAESARKVIAIALAVERMAGRALVAPPSSTGRHPTHPDLRKRLTTFPSDATCLLTSLLHARSGLPISISRCCLSALLLPAKGALRSAMADPLRALDGARCSNAALSRTTKLTTAPGGAEVVLECTAYRDLHLHVRHQCCWSAPLVPVFGASALTTLREPHPSALSCPDVHPIHFDASTRPGH